jgi:hypothetical protein
MVFLRVDPQLAALSGELRYQRLVEAVEGRRGGEWAGG